MLSPALEEEFFNIARKPDPIILEHITDALDELGYVVLEVNNFDIVISMALQKGEWSGTFRIDRMPRLYNINGTKMKCFADVENYLQSGFASVNQLPHDQH